MELVQELGGCEIVLVEPVSMDMTLEAQRVSGSAVRGVSDKCPLVVNVVSHWVGSSTECFTQLDLKHPLGISSTKSRGVQPFQRFTRVSMLHWYRI